MDHLNLCFRRLTIAWKNWIIAFGILLCSSPAFAVNLHALYTASCQREVGVILNISPRQIFLLNLRGEIVEVERFQVIYYVNYPIEFVPIPAVANPDLVPIVSIETLQSGRMQPLVTGWPVDFSQDKISFLTLRGSELSIDRTSIWNIEMKTKAQAVSFETPKSGHYEFVPPYAFSNCPSEASGATKKVVKVYPQDVLSDPVKIKKEMDRLEQSHRQLHRYESAQQFYPVPEVYTNETALGIWFMTGARYGASSNRANNFTPLLTNEFSSGPFGFQSEFRSGSGPISLAIHEETQTQIFYRMKADYFHLSLFIDPNLVLVGEKYKWTNDDLGGNDIRMVESAFLEFGFDYGRFALEILPGSAGNTAAQYQNLFRSENTSLPRFGLRYQGYQWWASFQAGTGSQNKMKSSIFRGNFEHRPNKFLKWSASIIFRDLDFDGTDTETNAGFQSAAKSKAVSGQVQFRFQKRMWAGFLTSIEKIEQSGGLTGSLKIQSNPTIMKFGTMIALSF